MHARPRAGGVEQAHHRYGCKVHARIFLCIARDPVGAGGHDRLQPFVPRNQLRLVGGHYVREAAESQPVHHVESHWRAFAENHGMPTVGMLAKLFRARRVLNEEVLRTRVGRGVVSRGRCEQLLKVPVKVKFS